MSRYRARTEDCQVASVPVGGRVSALDAALGCEYGAQELIADFRWGDEGERVTGKRTSLQTAPQHLIVMLRRFQFNFDTFDQVRGSLGAGHPRRRRQAS